MENFELTAVAGCSESVQYRHVVWKQIVRNFYKSLLSEVTLASNAYKHFLEYVSHLKTHNISELITFQNTARTTALSDNISSVSYQQPLFRM